MMSTLNSLLRYWVEKACILCNLDAAKQFRSLAVPTLLTATVSKVLQHLLSNRHREFTQRPQKAKELWPGRWEILPLLLISPRQNLFKFYALGPKSLLRFYMVIAAEV